MKRMLLLATASLVAAAMMVAMSVPAFAAFTCKISSDVTYACSGGESSTQPGGIATGAVGGGGGHFEQECGLPEGCLLTSSGGSGHNFDLEGAGWDDEGGGGGRCISLNFVAFDCTGPDAD